MVQGSPNRGSAGERILYPQRLEHALRDGLARKSDLLAQERRLAVGDVAVREADAHHPRPRLRLDEGVLEVLEDGGAEATGQDILLHGHDELVLPAQSLDELGVQGLGEAAIRDRHLEAVLTEDPGGAQGNLDAVAVAEESHPLTICEELAPADRDLLRPLRQRRSLGGATRIAEGDRAVVVGER